jgi:hypothetical protein
MNAWRWVDPRTKDVSTGDLKKYLRRRGWQEQPEPNPDVVRFQKQFAGGFRPYLVLPASDLVEDPPGIVHAITTLSELEDRHPVEVLNDILALAPAADGAAAAKGTKSPRRAAASE